MKDKSSHVAFGGVVWASAMRTSLLALAACRHGGVALIFALMLIPMTAAIGVAIDFGRVQMTARNIQGAVDAAALAGAEAFSTPTQQARTVAAAAALQYFNQNVRDLMPGVTLDAPTITAELNNDCSSQIGPTVTVAVNVTIPTTLISLVTPSMTARISAKASRPPVQFRLSGSNLVPSLTAADFDTLYWYRVPAGFTGVPSQTQLNYIGDNWQASNKPTSFTACISGGEKIGFALKAVHNQKRIQQMDGLGDPNAYGGVNLNTYWHYSTIYAPSSQNSTLFVDYPLRSGQRSNNVLQIIGIAQDGSQSPTFKAGVGFPLTGTKPFSSLAADGAVDCTALSPGTRIRYYWNDLGIATDWGGSIGWHDDLNYTDMVFDVTCEYSTSGTIVLVR